MCIDLVLKCTELRVFYQNLSLNVLIHKRLDVVQHSVNLVRKLSHFIVSSILRSSDVKVSASDCPDGREDFVELLQYMIDQNVNDKGHHEKDQDHADDVIVPELIYL